MNVNRKLMNLQLFAVPTNETMTSDLAPAISIDFTSRISENINTLQEILGVTSMTPMAAGTLIKLYKETVTVAEQVAEGEVINLSKVSRVLAGTKELVLGKYRKQVTAEAIQKFGRDMACSREKTPVPDERRELYDRIYTGRQRLFQEGGEMVFDAEGGRCHLFLQLIHGTDLPCRIC